MTVAISPEQLGARGQEFLADPGTDLLVIESEGRVLGALVSPEDYEQIRRIRAQRVLDAMDALGRHMASVATPSELDELVRELDRHNL